MSDQSLESRVRSWLSVSGYPLEMRVARACREASLATIQSEYVPNEDTQKNREIDVLAYRQIGVAGKQAIVALVIECKSDKSKPWIIFSNDTAYTPQVVMQKTPANSNAKHSLVSSGVATKAQSLPLFSMPERTGYTLVRAFEDKASDAAYQAISAVATASKSYVNQFNKPSFSSLSVLAFPVLVVDSPLFECYELAGDVELAEVEYGLMVWRNPLSDRFSVVRVVTADRFPELAVEMASSFDALLGAISGAAVSGIP